MTVPIHQPSVEWSDPDEPFLLSEILPDLSARSSLEGSLVSKRLKNKTKCSQTTVILTMMYRVWSNKSDIFSKSNLLENATKTQPQGPTTYSTNSAHNQLDVKVKPQNPHHGVTTLLSTLCAFYFLYLIKKFNINNLNSLHLSYQYFLVVHVPTSYLLL